MKHYVTQRTDLFVGLFYVNVQLFCVNTGHFFKSEEIHMEYYVTQRTDLFVGLFYVNIQLFCVNIALCF